MSQWKDFEQRVYNETKLQGIFVSRIPTGCRIIRGGNPPKVQLIKTDFDFTAGLPGAALFFDAKADSAKNFNFKSYVTRPKKLHQFKKMCEAADMGNLAGYLIWFYTLNQITFAPINVVRAMIREGAASLNPDTPGCRSQEDWLKLDLVSLCIPRTPPNALEQTSNVEQ
jgi:hypothetical protein